MGSVVVLLSLMVNRILFQAEKSDSHDYVSEVTLPVSHCKYPGESNRK